MRWVLLIMGFSFLLWGIFDFVTGTSTSGGRWNLPLPYSSKQLGPLFYVFAVVKIIAGAYAIWLTLYHLIKKI